MFAPWFFQLCAPFFARAEGSHGVHKATLANPLRFLLTSSSVEKKKKEKENFIHYAGLLNVL